VDATAMTKIKQQFPTSAGVLFGLGLGGFFECVMLHHVLQWNHMLSSVPPAETDQDLRFRILWDDLFHASAFIFVQLGFVVLWRSAYLQHLRWSGRMLAGSMLMGFGLFNLIEGLIDHEILGLHHVNETVPREEWVYWDMGFLLWGAVMLVGGYLIWRRGKRSSLRVERVPFQSYRRGVFRTIASFRR
jgi:uncharacterized membrane protein